MRALRPVFAPLIAPVVMIATMIVAGVSTPVFADDSGVEPLSPKDQALVQNATDYIQNLKGVKGRFTQIDPKGHVSTGTFYMQRPGKARFQYDPPAGELVVADGVNVSVYDSKLKSFEQYPLGQTPLVLLLAKNVRLDRGVAITGVEHDRDGFAIDARDAHKQAQGRISIRFSQSPIALKGWTVVDAQGQSTDVKLGPLTERPSLSGSLFVLHDPNPRKTQP